MQKFTIIFASLIVALPAQAMFYGHQPRRGQVAQRPFNNQQMRRGMPQGFGNQPRFQQQRNQARLVQRGNGRQRHQVPQNFNRFGRQVARRQVVPAVRPQGHVRYGQPVQRAPQPIRAAIKPAAPAPIPVPAPAPAPRPAPAQPKINHVPRPAPAQAPIQRPAPVPVQPQAPVRPKINPAPRPAPAQAPIQRPAPAPAPRPAPAPAQPHVNRLNAQEAQNALNNLARQFAQAHAQEVQNQAIAEQRMRRQMDEQAEQAIQRIAKRQQEYAAQQREADEKVHREHAELIHKLGYDKPEEEIRVDRAQAAAQVVLNKQAQQPQQPQAQPGIVREPANAQPVAQNGNLHECPICMIDKPVADFIRLTCGHQLNCRACLELMVDSAIKAKNTVNLVCHDRKCRHDNHRRRFDINDVRLITQDQNKINEITDIFTKEWGMQNGLKFCPGRPGHNCDYFFENPRNIREDMECPRCHSHYCAACLLPHNKHTTCQEAERKEADEREEREARQAGGRVWQEYKQRKARANVPNQQQLQKLGIKKCPRCNMGIQRPTGCNIIYCRCGHEFCWICLKPRRHDDGHRPCPLWS